MSIVGLIIVQVGWGFWSIISCYTSYEIFYDKGEWELFTGNLIMARVERCCNLYKTTMRSSKNNVTSTIDAFTKGVWRLLHGHTKVNNKDKKGILYRGFGGGNTHDVKNKVMQEGENSLDKSKVHGLVKLFENKCALKEEA